MTQHDAERYAEAVKKYEHEVKHIYFFPHDDKTIGGFFSRITLKVILLSALGIGIFIALFGVVMGLIDKDMLGGLKMSLGLVGIPLLAALPYSYLFYLNDIKDGGNDLIYSAIANIILFAVLAYFFNIENVYALIAIYIVATYIIMRVVKNISYSIEKPSPRDFDSEQPKIDDSSSNL